MSAAEGLLRASLMTAGLLLVALVAGRLLLSRLPGLRHGLLMGALLLAAAAPLWLLLVSRWGGEVSIGGDLRGVLDAPLAWVTAAPPSSAPRDAGIHATAAGGWLAPLLLAIWSAGALRALGRVGWGLRRIARLRRQATPHPTLPDVMISVEIAAAVVVGLRRPVILLAPDLANETRALAEVLAHERAHMQRRDPLWGLLERLVSATYWFHPAVWLVAREIRRAREEACDDQVLRQHRAGDYARTLLALALRTPAGTGVIAVQPAAGELERRVRRLLDPRLPARRRPLLAVAAGLAVLASATPLALGLAPVTGAGAGDGATSGTGGEVIQRPPTDSERAAFAMAGPAAAGALVLRDLSDGRTVVINPELASQRVTPASTFKMVLALAALEQGVAADGQHRLAWDGRPSPMKDWNRDHTLASAMATSANWYFLQLARQLDRRQLQQTLERLAYGNQNLGHDPGQAFMNGDLTISPREQVAVMARLAGPDPAISARAKRALNDMTLLSAEGGAQLHGKTGLAVGKESGTIAWLVGHVRRGERGHAFALLLRAPAEDMDRLRSQRVAIARRLLTSLGALPEAAR